MTTLTNPPAARTWSTRRTPGAMLLPYLLVAPPVLLVFFLIFYPAVQSFIRTLSGSGESLEGGYSASRYFDFFNSPANAYNLLYTIQITVISVAILFALCLPIALYLRFSKTRLSNIVQSLALFPIFVPGIILAYALSQFLGARGYINEIVKGTGIKPLMDVAYQLLGANGFRFPYLKPEAIVIGLVWESIPFTVLVLSSGLSQIADPLIESARDVGASRWQVFTRIIVPLITRPVIIALCLNFIGLFGSYTLPYILGPAAPQMMGVLMQSTYSLYLEPRAAETQAVITFGICLIVGWIYIRTVSRRPRYEAGAET